MNIETLRNHCLTLSGTEEDVKWDDNLCFMVGGKIYCITNLAGPFRVSFKVTPGQYEKLVRREGLIPAPYLARNKWVMAESGSCLSGKEWLFFIGQSYELVRSGLPKKIREALNRRI
jgi:predicted DNA-binding protein (MmcQ/YjbR family)